MLKYCLASLFSVLSVSSFTSSFHNPHLLLRQPIQFIHQLINRLVRRGNLPLYHRLFRRGVCGGEALVQIEHGLDEGDHAVMEGDFGGVGEVDRADGRCVMPQPAFQLCDKRANKSGFST